MWQRVGGLFLAVIGATALLALVGGGPALTRPDILPGDVVISEVGWGGTVASANDEWLELYNNTNAAISLDNWTVSDGGDMEVTLLGTIPAGAFFLLERTDDTTISDIPADQIYTGGLNNSGEPLTLRDNNGTLIDTANGNGGGWPAGTAASDYFSMERVDPAGADSDSNWANNDGQTRNGLDANGNPLNATPKQENSVWKEPPAGPANILIEAVLYDGYETGDGDEAVQLRNLETDPVDLSGWQLGDGGNSLATFPAGTSLPAGQTIWIAYQALAFQGQFGFWPAYELSDTTPLVPNLAGSWPAYANDGDEVLLQTGTTELVDVLVYENGDTGRAGWSGPAVLPYQVSNLFGEEGQILYRRRDQTTGRVVPDSNTANDWAQSETDLINGRKVLYPGWDLDAFFFTARVTQTAVLTVAIAPDNGYQAIVSQINAAQTSLQIESLTFENVAIANAIVSAAGRGVAVTVLLEGSPTGGLPDQEKYICQQIEAAGGACWFMISDDTSDIYDRYRYLHAKFIIVDGQRAIISSENLSGNSLPDDDKSDGTVGRRGTILMTDAPAVVARLQAIFLADFDPTAHLDLFRWTAGHETYGLPPAGFVPITVTGGTTYTVHFPTPLTLNGSFAFEVIQSPETSLRDQDSLLGLVNRVGPGDTLLVEQLNERPHWGESGSNPSDDPNLRLEAYLAAGRRGATVRLLLDRYFLDPSDPLNNQVTCDYVNNIAHHEDLDLKCALGNPAGLGIHNKMVLALIDGQGWLHVGSINGTEQSSKGNRELALQVQSNAAYNLLATMFQFDWPNQVILPIILNSYNGPTDHLLISEILYDPFGLDDAEFIELVNPTDRPIDLSDWTIGDAVNPTDFEDVRRFPAGTTILPGDSLVIATSATAFNAIYGFNPDFEIVSSDPTVPDLIDDPAWGDPAALLQLGNSGDEVLLRDPAGQVIDVITYGNGNYSGLAPCPLVSAPDHSLERYPYWQDTNNCPTDFRDWPFPNPGSLPA